MKFGVRVMPRPPLQRMRDVADRALDAGLHSLWWPDHLMGYSSPEMWKGGDRAPPDAVDLHTYIDPFIAMATVAGTSQDLMLGTAVTDSVRRMPATLVQTVLTLDHVAPGRVILGLGAGEAANIVPYGWDVSGLGARFRAAAAEIRQLLDDPGPDERGAIMGLRPARGSPGPQLWLAAHGPLGLETVGRYADGWLPTFLGPEAWSAGRQQVVRTARRQGRDPSQVTFGLSLNVVMADHHEDAHRVLADPVTKRLCLLMGSEELRAAGMAEHPLGSSALHTVVATRQGEALARAARMIPFEVVHRLIPHGTVSEIASHIERFDGLEHVRLLDLGASDDPLLEISRIRRVAQILTGA